MIRWCLLSAWATLVSGPVAAADPVPVAHRGLAAFAPENTLPAFRACFELKLGIELDIRRAASGELVCLHDDTLDRTTDGTGPVADKTARELAGVDAGGWFHPAFQSERVPHLSDVFAVRKGKWSDRDLIALDLKAFDENTPADLARLVTDTEADRRRLVCIGQAIDTPAVRTGLKAADPKLPIAVLAQTRADLEAAIADQNSDWVYIRFVPTTEDVTRCHNAGKKVFAVGSRFAPSEAEGWQAAANAGVDAILTDHPLKLRAAVAAPSP